MTMPYKVVTDNEGCEKCHDGYTWKVVNEVDITIGSPFDKRQDAESFCHFLNLAYVAGQTSMMREKKYDGCC